MRDIGLMITPGQGYQEVQVTDSTTVEQLVHDHNLQGRTITLDGKAIDPSEFASRTLAGVDEVWATGGAKGA